MLKTPLLSLLLVAAATALVPAAAQAAKPAKFMATYEGTLKTTWDTPRHTLGGSCFRINWSKGTGEETWSVRSRRAQKVVVSGSGANLAWRAGTHETTGDVGDPEFLAGGLITRTSLVSSGWDAGTCAGATSGVNPPRETDCGTLLPSYALRFTRGLKGGLVVMPMPASTARNEKQYFDRCSLIVADELTPGAWPDTAGKVSAKQLFGTAKSVTVAGKDSWTQVLNQGRPGETTTTTTLSWTAKLKRVR